MKVCFLALRGPLNIAGSDPQHKAGVSLGHHWYGSASLPLIHITVCLDLSFMVIIFSLSLVSDISF